MGKYIKSSNMQKFNFVTKWPFIHQRNSKITFSYLVLYVVWKCVLTSSSFMFIHSITNLTPVSDNRHRGASNGQSFLWKTEISNEINLRAQLDQSLRLGPFPNWTLRPSYQRAMKLKRFRSSATFLVIPHSKLSENFWRFLCVKRL